VAQAVILRVSPPPRKRLRPKLGPETEAEDARREGATLLQILDSRAIAVTSQVREDITASTDLGRLHSAILRAATADPGDLFTF